MDYMVKWKQFITENKAREGDPRDSNKITKAILVKDNKVLVLKGPHNWELPGGHIHVDEEKMDGLKREIKEETGLDLDSAKEIAIHGKRTIYTADLPQGDIKLSSEHTKHKMISVEDLDDYDLKDIYKEEIRGVLK